MAGLDSAVGTTINAKDCPGSAVKHRWLYRAKVTQIAAVAAMFGVGIWSLLAGTDLLAEIYHGAVTIPVAVMDSLVGLACGALLFKIMLSERARHQRVVAHLRMIAEVNHHIRNALERIELTAHVTHNQQLISDIEGGVQRIQWALTELLPENEETDEERDQSLEH